MRFATYFFIMTLVFWTVANCSISIKPEPLGPIHTVPTFTNVVEGWAKDLGNNTSLITTEDGVEGNCLPVSMELQKRIVATGRKAHIALVREKGAEVGHALVLFNSDIDGSLDSIIDNGFATQHNVKPRDFLDIGLYGEYVGTCNKTNLSTSSCIGIGIAY